MVDGWGEVHGERNQKVKGRGGAGKEGRAGRKGKGKEKGREGSQENGGKARKAETQPSQTLGIRIPHSIRLALARNHRPGSLVNLLLRGLRCSLVDVLSIIPPRYCCDVSDYGVVHAMVNVKMKMSMC